MSKSTPAALAEPNPLWVFREFLTADGADEVLTKACEIGRVERWGHAAQIPVWAKGDEVVLVVDGTIVAEQGPDGSVARLTRGDAFGKTTQGRVAASTDQGAPIVQSIRETTICSISRDELRELWDAERASRVVDAGRWFRKEEVEVPVWPLLGTLPTTRLARILVHLVEQYGEIDGSKGRLPLTIKPAQLADLAGIDKKRATHVWNLFDRAHLVEVTGGNLVLSDLERLRQYALAG